RPHAPVDVGGDPPVPSDAGPDALVPLVQLVAPAPKQATVEVHEVANLGRGALPVLGGERVPRGPPQADVDGPVDHVEQRLLASGVTFAPGQPALLRPPPVAVHDDPDV